MLSAKKPFVKKKNTSYQNASVSSVEPSLIIMSSHFSYVCCTRLWIALRMKAHWLYVGIKTEKQIGSIIKHLSKTNNYQMAELTLTNTIIHVLSSRHQHLIPPSVQSTVVLRRQ